MKPSTHHAMLACIFAATLLLVTGCASSGPPSTGPAPDPTAADGDPAQDPRLLVVLPPAPPRYLDRVTRELAGAHSLNVVAAWQMESLGQRCVVFTSRTRRPLHSVVRSIAGDPRIDTVEPIHHYETQGGSAPSPASRSPKEPYRHLQHAADTLALDAAHTLATGQAVKVAVIDTGADLQHPELHGRVSLARDFVRRPDGFTADRHGTAVAGLIAAAADNGFGIVGVAPRVDLMLLKACWSLAGNPAKASCDSYTLALALDFAIVNDSQVINMSLGGPGDSILEKLLDAAHAKGIAVVAAAGREPAQPMFPASLDTVLAVAAAPLGPEGLAAEPTRAPPSETSWLAAPGEEILATTPGGAFDFFSGSSMAAAQVSGVVALLLENRRDLSPEQLEALLRATAKPLDRRLVVDACAAVGETLDQRQACVLPPSAQNETDPS